MLTKIWGLGASNGIWSQEARVLEEEAMNVD
jgi:hypothetical protein